MTFTSSEIHGNKYATTIEPSNLSWRCREKITYVKSSGQSEKIRSKKCEEHDNYYKQWVALTSNKPLDLCSATHMDWFYKPQDSCLLCPSMEALKHKSFSPLFSHTYPPLINRFFKPHSVYI